MSSGGLESCGANRYGKEPSCLLTLRVHHQRRHWRPQDVHNREAVVVLADFRGRAEKVVLMSLETLIFGSLQQQQTCIKEKVTTILSSVIRFGE